MANDVQEAEVDALRIMHELWWMETLQGAFAVFFGITALFWPGLTLATLIYLFSAFILAVGIIEIIHSILNIHRRSTWWVGLILGLIALGVGTYLVRHPRVTFRAFILILGLTLIARGIIQILRMIADKAAITNRVLLGIVGALSIIAGIIILLQPAAGGVAFVWILGLYAVVYGAMLIAASFGVHRELEQLRESLSAAPGMLAADTGTSRVRGGRA